MNKHASRRTRSIIKAVRSAVDTLEQRRLLTAMFGGETLLMQTFDETGIEITLEGPDTVSLDIIGATLDENFNARLNDIPASISGPNGSRNVLGGYAGRFGVQPVRGPTVSSPINVTDTSPFGLDVTAPSSRVTVSAIASNPHTRRPGGQTLGFNLFTATGVGGAEIRIFQLLSFNRVGTNYLGSATVVDFELGPKMLDALNRGFEGDPDARPIRKADGTAPDLSDIEAPFAADWDPNPDNAADLYFGANVSVSTFGTDGNRTDKDVPLLFRYRNGQVTVVSDFGSGQRSENTRESMVSEVTDFNFVPGNGGNRAMLLYGTRRFDIGVGDDARVASATGFYYANTTATDFATEADNPITVFVDGDEVTDFAGFSVQPDLNAVYLINGDGDNARLIRINNATNITRRGLDYGGLLAQQNFGRNIGQFNDLTWNARAIDPVTGGRGAFMAADFNADQLVYIDYRERFSETALFNMVVRNSTPDTRITVRSIEPPGATGDAKAGPYKGNAGAIRWFNGNEPENFDLRDNTGLLYLGMREPAATDVETTPELVIPVLSLDTSTFAGNVPRNLGSTVQAGAFIQGSAERFFFDGTITGLFNVDGGLQNFYAGNVLTGDAAGTGRNGERNFYIAGDAESVIIKGDAGTFEDAPTRPFYSTGLDMYVNGMAGKIRVGGDFRGALAAEDRVPGFMNGSVLETETKRTNAASEIAIYKAGFISNTVENNDATTRAEILYSHQTGRRDPGTSVVTGTLKGTGADQDLEDWYGMALIAGQEIDVQMASQSNPVKVEVFDPDGKLVHSDATVYGPGVFNLPTRIKITSPGIWKFRASYVRSNPPPPTTDSYNLVIRGGGSTGLGSLSVRGNVIFTNPQRTVEVQNTDAGAIEVGGFVRMLDYTSAPMVATNGNFRAFVANAIGSVDVLDWPTLTAPRGSVGRIQSTQDMFINPLMVTSDTLFTPVVQEPEVSLAVGQDIQLVVSGGDLNAALVANRGIGTIRAQSIGNNFQNFAGLFRNDADNTGDGFIDLIDSAGDIGNQLAGGPSIENGPGGNVRYMYCRDGIVYRDPAFGRGPAEVTNVTNDSIRVFDDSGSQITFTPLDNPLLANEDSAQDLGIPTDPFGGYTGVEDPFGGATLIPGTTAPPAVGNSGSLAAVLGTVTINTYGVRSGGSIVYNAAATTSLRVSTVANDRNDRGEIGKLVMTGSGVVLNDTLITDTTDPFSSGNAGRQLVPSATGRDLNLFINGAPSSGAIPQVRSARSTASSTPPPAKWST
jgi:hypothetical protein